MHLVGLMTAWCCESHSAVSSKRSEPPRTTHAWLFQCKSMHRETGKRQWTTNCKLMWSILHYCASICVFFGNVSCFSLNFGAWWEFSKVIYQQSIKNHDTFKNVSVSWYNFEPSISISITIQFRSIIPSTGCGWVAIQRVRQRWYNVKHLRWWLQWQRAPGTGAWLIGVLVQHTSAWGRRLV